MKYTIYLLIFVLIGCSNHDSKVILTKVSDSDTIINIRIKGILREYIVHKHTLEQIPDLQNVIDKFSNKLEYKSEKSDDITGEGIHNLYETTIKQKGDGFIVTNTIKQNDTVIWIDTLTVNDNIWYYWEDSVFFQLKPYSQFYIAYKDFNDFVGERFDTTTELYKNNKMIIHNYIGYENDSAYWKDYLGNFKGRIIYNLTYEDGGIYLWDKRQRKFIPIYEP
ncbi:MAG: hypothetical protein JXB49_20075 [Bacteroidales bacterium]|nr:hypothetical protein [Bacteroidales bacterium]